MSLISLMFLLKGAIWHSLSSVLIMVTCGQRSVTMDCIMKYCPFTGLLLEAGTRVPAPVYYEHSTHLCCLGIEKGKPKKS